ncbi:hypothetical protein [Auritidibacter sp. NML120636]|uniref:hypothetical protein n=1 Tax=Auritidibacter sp. NML120636 TaxID=2170743 RepID=UPI0018F1BB46|nr:hypothetical protein [Auritidibacter sp. NML120636]
MRLPPFIGFVASGFALNAAGVKHVESLDLLAVIGVTLMLFSIGLRLRTGHDTHLRGLHQRPYRRCPF